MPYGFFVSAFSNSVGTLLVDWVAKPVKLQLDYLRHFHENIEKFKEQKQELARAQARLQREVKEAENQLLEIEVDVRVLLSKVDDILTTAESMELEIEKNKRCFGRCPDWWWRYRLTKKLMKKNLVIFELLERTAKFGEPGRVAYRSTCTIPTIEFLSSKDFVVSKASKKAFSQIFEALGDDSVSTVGLWGMGGSGKTTLAREVGNRAKQLNLFDKVVITTVSRRPNFKIIQDEIAKFIAFDMNSGQSRRSEQELWLRLQKEKKILIILDDVWAEINLKEKIGIPLGEDHKGCKVLLTTRRLQVCRSMQCQRTVPLECLYDEEAWALFKMKASLENFDDAIKEVAAQVVQKCKGLPIAIVTLGSALKGNTNLERWETTYRRLQNRRLTDIEDINEENAYLCLEVSFDYLKDIETRMCFLLCSLFPEDYEIHVEYLVRFAWGLELYEGINSIEEVRSEVLAAIDILKNSCLLLDSREKCVKMHDIVRDVALWIASSKREISFSIKSEVVETWLENESFEPYAAISFKNSQIDYLPKALICQNLKILLILQDDHEKKVEVRCPQDTLIASKVSQFQTNLKTLHLQSCRLVDISILGKLTLTNLRTLHLESCVVDDISILGKLKMLEVLSFAGSGIIELPEEIGNLKNLKLLDLNHCGSLYRIPPNLIRKLSKLQELLMYHCESLTWETENTIEEERYANISELNALPNLTILYLNVRCMHIPKDYVFQKLQRYDICVEEDMSFLRLWSWWNNQKENNGNLPIRRSLRIEASMIDACKQLFRDVESLYLKNLVSHQNLVPSLELELEQQGFNKLICLALDHCNDVRCLVDTTRQHALTAAFSNLVSLTLTDLQGLEVLCNAHQPQGFLQKLKTLEIVGCKEMRGGIPILQNLETLKVIGCEKIQDLFQTAVSLKSLKYVRVRGCNELRYLFPAAVANSLGQLENLFINDCKGLEEIIQETQVSNSSLQSLRIVYVIGCNMLTSLSSLSHGHVLHNLEAIRIFDCCRLEYTFPNSMAQGLPQLKTVSLKELPQLKGMDGNEIMLTLPSLQQLNVTRCPQLTPFIISTKIQELELSCMMGDTKQSSNMIQVPELRGRSPNMEYLTITNFEDHLFDAVSYNLSCLKELHLRQLPELRVIWKGSIQVVNFQNLNQVDIMGCGMLRFIFTATTARNLPQLSSLTIEECNGLEQIIEKDETLSQDHRPIYFPNLVKIWISKCANLKSLFAISVAFHLPKLQMLDVQRVCKLEKVFEKGDEVNVSKDNEKVVHLPQLESLSLERLPYLKYFSPMVYRFVFPSLKSLHVRDCPNIATSFSVDSKQCGHARTETIPSIDENIVEETSTTQETTWSIGTDIHYRRKF